MEIKLTSEEQMILHDAVATWGEKLQHGILQEEAAELIQAISHYSRGKDGSYSQFCEEMADCLICLCQMWLLHSENINYYYDKKVKRLKERLNKLHKEQEERQ